MLQITKEYKEKVLSKLLEIRKNFDGSDSAFAKQWGINNSVYSRLKNNEIDGLLRDNQWLNIGRELEVSLKDRVWKMVKTEVFEVIEQDIVFCQEYAKGMIFVDECGIGKTYAAKYLSRTLKNCFYVDASQAKTKQAFVRLLARTIGLESGKYLEMKANIKHYLKMLPNPIVIVDEAGDLEYNALLDLKEFWNGTENACGWYMIGADGLKEKINRGISSKKVGFRELFSRYSENFSSVVPNGNQERLQFYKNLVTAVASVNLTDKSMKNQVVNRCITIDANGNIGGLRRLEAVMILTQKEV
ncbi:MAG: AAA family ATPase [Flectobacillus sp.]|uniref:AAA family ATPase n=1 Tax=Flectobacillus sp. TaxID=50419 RepID=UPI003B9D828F